MGKRGGSRMTMITCDFVHAERFPGEPAGCGEEFRSASEPKIVSSQAEHAGWLIEKKPKRGDTAATVRYYCPHHKHKAMAIGTQAQLPSVPGSIAPRKLDT